MIGITALPVRATIVSKRGKATVAHGISETVKDTIKPRVNELRRNQLSAGTTDVGSAHLPRYHATTKPSWLPYI